MKSHNKFSAKISIKEYIPILKGIVDIFFERSQHRSLLCFKTQDKPRWKTDDTFSSQNRMHE